MSEDRYYTQEASPESGVIDLDPIDPEFGGERRDETFVQATLAEMAQEAHLHRENNLDEFIEEATSYYNAELFGGEEGDRSQVVLPVVRNAVRQTMPSLLRVFFGSEDVVEFSPNQPEDIELAEEQTEFVNRVVVQQDNNGFLIVHDWFKDALVLRLGTVKWWWERKTHEQVEEFESMTQEQITALAHMFEQEPGIDFEVDVQGAGADPNTGENLFDVTVRETITDGRAKFDVVPPEEMIWSPNGRDKNDARVVGHVRAVPADELIAMGYDEDDILPHAGERRALRSDSVEDARRFTTDSGESHITDDSQDPLTLPTQFAELFARIDVDGDGIAELRKFECVGLDFEVLNRDARGLLGEPVNRIPFAFLTPDPQPHHFVGLAQSDSTMPLQKVESYVARGMLDSLSEAIDPAKVTNPRRTNLKDVMSRKLSRVIRTKDDPQSAVHAFVHPWVGEAALPVLEFLNRETEKAVGMPALTAGLEAKALQSSTREGVRASVDGSQQQLEMIARIFAETGVKDLFEGLLELIVEHKDETRRRVVKLRGQYVEPDLDRWDATMDVRVNVALGTGLVEDKINTLNDVLSFQMTMLETGSPIVSWAEIRSTMAKIIELSGHPDPSLFLKPFGAQEQAQFEQAQAQQGQQDPAAMLAQIEAQKAENERQEAESKLLLEAEKLRMEDDRERDKMAQDFALRSEELALKHQAQVATEGEAALTERLKAVTEDRRADLEADLERERIASEERARRAEVAAQPASPTGGDV